MLHRRFRCDGFKDVNDSLGHAVGDAVLKVVADRLRDFGGDRHLACRLGGDEFVLLREDVADPFTAMDMASRLVQVIEAAIELEERSVYVGASVGVAILSDEGREAKRRGARAAGSITPSGAGQRRRPPPFASMQLCGFDPRSYSMSTRS